MNSPGTEAKIGKQTSENEFILLVALITSLMALSIDALLPALLPIGEAFQLDDTNQVQWLVSSVFAGFAIGGLVSGPLADAYGRRPVAFIGGALFVLGCIISMFTESFEMLIFSRVLQGLGASGPRIAVQAMVRDRFVGDAMARVMSFITAIFILTPLIAPSLGHWVYQTAGWRAIFLMQAATAAASLLWLAWRQAETLVHAKKSSAAPIKVMQTYIGIVRTPQSLRYILVSSLSSAPFMAYLALSPQLLEQQYGFGDSFALVFAALAFPYGVSSMLNGKLVLRLGTRYLVQWALGGCALLALIYIPVIYIYQGHPPTWTLMFFLGLSIVFLGLLSGNLTALTLEPLGHVAGSGAALHGAMSTGGSMALGAYIGSFYDNSPMPLALSYLLLCGISFWLTRSDPLTKNRPPQQSIQTTSPTIES